MNSYEKNGSQSRKYGKLLGLRHTARMKGYHEADFRYYTKWLGRKPFNYVMFKINVIVSTC